MGKEQTFPDWDDALSRRQFLYRAGMSALSIPALAAVAAACGVGGEEPQLPGETLEPLPPLAKVLIIANWPLYIDEDEDTGKHQTVEDFQAETGIAVTYRDIIADNESFFGTIREPLSRGQSTGWDLMVVTDWLVAKMIRLGYIEPIHLDRITNFTANAAAILKNRSYDPGNRYSIPWQSGITGIGYNPKLTGREITKFEDLFDPAFKGRVGMFTEMRDTVNLGLLNIGVPDVQKATIEDVRRVMDKLRKQRDDGIVRAYYGNEYADALAKGDLAVTIAWSGDIFQLQFDNPDLRFVVPEEGGILWTDNMVIPRGAEHPTDAHEWMNFVYRPKIAAQIAEYVNYITPVPATKDVILANAAAASGEDREYLESVANSPLVFPTPDMEARLQSYAVLTEDEEKQWLDLFQEVVQG